MSIEASGLAVAASRYKEALDFTSVEAFAVVVGRHQHPEHEASVSIPDLESVPAFIEGLGRGPCLIFWIGLHSDADLYQTQLSVMAHLRSSHHRNVVLPERTTMTDRGAYSAFERRAADDLGVVALLHLNDFEAKKWRGWQASIPSWVLPVPVPRAHLILGRQRLDHFANGPSGTGDVVHRPPTTQVLRGAAHSEGRLVDPARRTGAIAFMGRLTERKGADLLVGLWPAWRRQAATDGLDLSLHIFGRDFEVDQPIGGLVRRMQQDETQRLTWNEQFFDSSSLSKLPHNTVAVSLSRQDFDGIAASEFLALGIPVVATPTTGHRAIAARTRGVLIEEDTAAVYAAFTRLLDQESEREVAAAAGLEYVLSQRSHSAAARTITAICDSLTP